MREVGRGSARRVASEKGKTQGWSDDGGREDLCVSGWSAAVAPSSVSQYVTACDRMSVRDWECKCMCVCACVGGVKTDLMELDGVHNREDTTS